MAGLTPLAQTARRRPKPAGDEEASSVLKLGEMSNSAALSTAAAHELLIKIEEARQKDPKLPLTHNDLIRKNTAYLEVFARHKGSDTVQQVTSEAETLTQLAEFERAQLGEFLFFVLDVSELASERAMDLNTKQSRHYNTERTLANHGQIQARSAAIRPKKRAR